MLIEKGQESRNNLDNLKAQQNHLLYFQGFLKAWNKEEELLQPPKIVQ
jgi:hypothetical protein